MRSRSRFHGNFLLALLSLVFAPLSVRADTFVVDNTNDDGPGSLRLAIMRANTRLGPDNYIVFHIEPGGPQTISPVTPLPEITGTVTIDGTTQPGYEGTPLIELEGSAAETTDIDGLRIQAVNCVVRGLVINRFGGSGIFLGERGGGNSLIELCYIGTDASGTVALGNTNGITIHDSVGNIVSQNLVSGNALGVWIEGSSIRNRVVANYIGTDLSGGVAVGNLQGVLLEAASGNSLSANLISGNLWTGVSVGYGAAGNEIDDNWIGLSAFAEPLPNGLDGVDVWEGTDNVLRGNVIAANPATGVVLRGAATGNNRIEANSILGNVFGVEIREGSFGNAIGGTAPEAQNIISGSVVDGVAISGAGTHQNTIENNDIAGNGQYGVSVFSSDNAITGNRIAENGLDGVLVGASEGSPFAVHVPIRFNAIGGNGDLGIRLDGDGNNLQPAPVLSLARSDATTSEVVGTLSASPGTTFEVQFFASGAADPSGFGEGETYLGSLSVTTSAGGSALFTASLPAIPLGNVVSATATSPAGDTSEFSNALAVGEPGPASTLTGLDPSSATAGGGSFLLRVRGEGFVSGSVVHWNGVDRDTEFVSGTELIAAIPAADIARAGTALVTVFNPAPGGGISNALTFTINNPTPALTGLSPDGALRGGSAFTLTVTGTGFVSGSIVRWNGADRTTTFDSPTRLTASIPASDLATAGNVSVTVFNPTPGGGTSNGLTFAVRNPAPTLAGLSPGSVTAGSSSLVVTLTGTNFVPESKARWNGADRDTVYLSPTQLRITLTRADLAAPGSFSVTVFNPTPGGGTSAAVPFQVIGTPQFAVASATATRSGSVGVTFTLKNVGTAPATSCRITVATLAGVHTNNVPALPISFPNLAAGATSAPITLSFPGSVTAGGKVLAVTATASGKSLTASRLVTVP